MRDTSLHLIHVENKLFYQAITLRRYISHSAVAIFWGSFLLAYVALISIPGFVGTDDYYHSRIAAQIVEQRNLHVDFPWLPLTILSNDQFVDHHLLYHLYLAPWMRIGGITGVKIAQSIIMGGIAISFWALLRLLQVRIPEIWTVGLLALSSPFLYRVLMIRTQGAAVLLMLIALHLLFTRRYRWMIAAAFAFTWLYNGFILMPIIAALYCLSMWITERQFIWQPLAYAVLGVILGLVVNPYFPQNIAFVLDHLGEKVDIAGSVRVGSEWYPYTTAQLLNNSLGAMVALVAGIFASSFRKVGRDHTETTLLFVTLLTLYMVFESRRFIEYFPIFALLFCAVALGRNNIDWSEFLPSALRRHFAHILPPVVLVALIMTLGFSVLRAVYDDVQNAKSHEYLAGASAWLKENTSPGELVFQTDWDDFTRLFYHNTHNVYLIGLDPTYLQVADPFMWNQWVAITQGQVDRPSVVIRETFGARFVVSDTHHKDFAQTTESDPNMRLVYRDDNSLIWQVLNDEQSN